MKTKIFTALAALAFFVSAIGFDFASAQTALSGANQLAESLPESDGVITLDADRLINEALPQILSGNQPKLAEIMGKIDKIKAKTGLDLKDFEHVAVGLKSKNVSDEEIDLEPLVLARGKAEAKALIALARLASNGEYTTEKFAGRTIHIFSTQKIIEKNKPKKDDDSFLGQIIDRMVKGLSSELAVAEFDKNTLAVGTLARVKEAIGDSPRVNGDVLALLKRKPNSIANLGAVLPEGLSEYLSLENDELGKSLHSIRELQSSLDVNDGNAEFAFMARTTDPKQAETLEGTLIGFQTLGKSLLARSDKPKNKVFARLVENAKITRDENVLMLDLIIPKTDLDVIVGQN